MPDAAADRRIGIVALASCASVAITVATGVPIVRIVVNEVPGPRGRAGAPPAADGCAEASAADWAVLPFEGRRIVGAWPAEVRLMGGRLILDLPGRVCVADFEAVLHTLLSDLRIHVLEGCGLCWRSGILVAPVPASLPRREERLGAIATHAVFAIDPSCALPLLARLAIEARLTLIHGTGEQRP